MIYLLIASFLWGTSFIAGKIAYNMFDPSLVVALRYIFASIILSPVTISFIRQEKETINKKDFFMLILLGILTYPLTSMLQFIGLSFTSASSATTIIGIEPIMITMIGFIFFKEKISPLVLRYYSLFGSSINSGGFSIRKCIFFWMLFSIFIYNSGFILGSTFKKSTYKNKFKLLYSINYPIRNNICFTNNAIFSEKLGNILFIERNYSSFVFNSWV